MIRSIAQAAVLLAVVAVVVAGCSLIRRTLPPSTDVALTTDAVAYPSGGEVQLQLRNVFNQRIGYNLCFSQLERNVNGTWERVDEDRNCTAELRLLAPGDTATYTLELPEAIAAGTYRYMTHVESMDDTTERPEDDGRLASNPFEVQG